MNVNENGVVTTATNGDPGTGASSAASTTPVSVTDQAPAADPVQQPDLQGEVDRWKHFSRENEQRAKDNYAKLQQKQTELDTANTELSQLRMQNARLNARLKYPSVTDEMFDKLCNVTDPDKIDAWAESLVALTHVGEQATPVEPKQSDPGQDAGDNANKGGVDPSQIPQSMKKMLKSLNNSGTFDSKPNPKDVYDRMLEKQQNNGKAANK